MCDYDVRNFANASVKGTTWEIPAPYAPLTSVPFFSTGRLSVAERLPQGGIVFALLGEPGLRYLVEKRHPPQNWIPLLILTNTLGTTKFTDPDYPENSALNFYRSRILD